MSNKAKAKTILANTPLVYEAGVRDGQGGQGGGGDSAFWDAYQKNADGTDRTDYRYAFAYAWRDELFKPVKDIVPTGDGGRLMFYQTNITDLAGLLEASKVTLDCSGATDLYQAFESPNITSLPALNLSACINLTLAFRYVQAPTIVLNNLRADCKFDRTFNSCSQLENLTISGTIGASGLNVTDCKNLSTDSLLNILNCLSTDGAGKTVTLGATNKQKLIDNGYATNIAAAEANNWTVA